MELPNDLIDSQLTINRNESDIVYLYKSYTPMIRDTLLSKLTLHKLVDQSLFPLE